MPVVRPPRAVAGHHYLRRLRTWVPRILRPHLGSAYAPASATTAAQPLWCVVAAASGSGDPRLDGQEWSDSGQNCDAGSVGDEDVSESKKPAPDIDSTKCEETSSATGKPKGLLTINSSLVPESSLRPVTGRNSHILKQQKINLLDIHAALPEEASRASKSQQIRRRSRRAFVKHAQSISEMVVATSVLERMIKSEFLMNDWWYWSSLTVAIKTSTVSSLAPRIHTLDDCIMYTKEPNAVPADSTKVVNKGRGKEPEPSSS
ncbi:methyl-CpG-binding domain-containing protein 9-like [Triticum dicoccoides]|uniref:methyl-CpG-binding domain-containing protein 9-like n=1 Tax=Triticum dicoccoides TaxID=85692 RepID=UPI000E795B79|nr:methyl-CpG-binding domain-containing protein 9-like [Triticum dicoccoides]